MRVHEAFRQVCESLDYPVQFTEVTSSTNDEAKAEVSSVDVPMKVYLTTHQKSGRGRGQNTWINSEAGSALMCSLSFQLEKPAQPIAAALFGLGLYKALEQTWPTMAFALKAPNDLLLNGKKCAGILTEAVQIGASCRLIAGFGLNVFSWPREVSHSTCLAQSSEFDANQLQLFFERLLMEVTAAALASQVPHMTDSQRGEILEALNRNPNLATPFLALSPFGDLTSTEESISWKDL